MPDRAPHLLVSLGAALLGTALSTYFALRPGQPGKVLVVPGLKSFVFTWNLHRVLPPCSEEPRAGALK